MNWKHVNPHGPSSGDTKTCAKCLEVKSLSEFYKDKVNVSGYRSWCKACMKQDSKTLYHTDGSAGKLRNIKTLEARKLLKQELVTLAGGCCSRCGYNRSISALDFHHINNDKEGTIANLMTFSPDKAREEARKCLLLCANCHREHHAGEW